MTVELIQNDVSTETMIEPIERPKRGFAALTKTQIAEIAARGGRAAHARGTAHKFNSESGKLAASKTRRGPGSRGPKKKEVSSGS